MSVATQLFPGMFPLFPAVDGAHHTNENSTSSSSTASSSTTDSSGVRVVVCKRSSRRRVRFADTVTYHEAPRPPAVSQDEEPQEESSWYTSREYEFLRQLTLRQAQQVSDLESNNLDEPFSYQRVWERIYTACTEGRPVSAYDYCHLQRHIRTTPARWGLETWCIPQLLHDRRRPPAIVDAVQQAYAAGENVRLASIYVSNASTLFAQAVAHGLELSLQNDR